MHIYTYVAMILNVIHFNSVGLVSAVYADNIETIQDNSNEGSVEECKEYNGGGSVYVRWGHDQCPSTAQLVYTGRAGRPFYNQNGGGSNPQCLPLEPNFLTPITGLRIEH